LKAKGLTPSVKWLPVTGYRLQVTGYRLQVAGYRLQVAGCRLQVAGCRLQVTDYGWEDRPVLGASDMARQRFGVRRCAPLLETRRALWRLPLWTGRQRLVPASCRTDL